MEHNVSRRNPSPIISLIRAMLGGMWQWGGGHRLGGLVGKFRRMAAALDRIDVSGPVQRRT